MNLALSILALLATVGFAWHQLKGAGHIVARLERIVDRLDLVEQSLPTRVIGRWPRYALEVTNLIGHAEESITILCDHQAFCIFSDNEAGNAYRKTLENRLAVGVSARMAFLSEPLRMKHDEQTTPHEDEWNPEFHALVARFFSGRDYQSRITRSALLAELEQSNMDTLSGFRHAAEVGRVAASRPVLSVFEVKVTLPLVFWIRDRREAIFAVVDHKTTGKRPVAFKTTDPGLINALESIFDRYIAEAAAQPIAAPPSGDDGLAVHP